MKNELKASFTEHWKYLAISSACELNLFDKILEGQTSIEKLIAANHWSLKALSDLVDFLVSDGYVCYGKDQILLLSEKGHLLRENNPDGLFHACLNWSGEHLNAWQNLSYSVTTGKSSFKHIYRKPYFEYLNDHPEKLHRYHQAMYEYARDDYHQLPDIINFGVHRSVMDVGGGYGALISLIGRKYNHINCYLFDMQKVIDKTVDAKIEKIGGDFFVGLPSVAEAMLLSRVLHDWNDEKALIILRNCFDALPDDGTLYVIENAKDKTRSSLSLLSLNMTVICESFERTSGEYIELCKRTGLRFQSEKQLNDLQTILIFKK